MERACDQVGDHGVELVDREVVDVGLTVDGFEGSTEWTVHESRYLVFATGYARDLAGTLGCEFTAIGGTDVVDVDPDYETTVADAYAIGWTARPEKIQAAISVGTGAAAGLDILSKEKGEAFNDFDMP